MLNIEYYIVIGKCDTKLVRHLTKKSIFDVGV
jgi:hypothetical protein